MAGELFIGNAVITGAKLQFARGSFLEVWLHVRHEGGEQGFGGYVLGGNPFENYPAARHAEQPNLAAEFIGAILKIAGEDDWDKLRGSVIRIEREVGWDGVIKGIGHAVDDLWFRPEQRFVEMRENAARAAEMPEPEVVAQ